MKYLLLITLTLPTLSWSVEKEWKVVAETIECGEKIQILGKEDEKYVLALRGNNERIKLLEKRGTAFKTNSLSTTEYVSDKDGDVLYSFIRPSYVEGNLPKIDILQDGVKKRCKMDPTADE